MGDHGYDHDHTQPQATSDDRELAHLGKKQVLVRRFNFWSLFGFAVCELITWETVLALFDQGLENGGPGGLVYGFIIAWCSTLSVYSVISELASMAPIAAGQYYWSYILAPQRCRVFVSYCIGWLTTMAWIATVATETMFAGTMLQGLLVLDYSPGYSAELWQGTLLTWCVVLVAVFVNVVIPAALPRIEIGTVVFHISGFLVIIGVLWTYTNPLHSARFVFASSLNEGGWSSQGLSYCVGFMGNVATFVGADASVHLAEEVSNASLTIPRVITCSMLLNGVVGFVMMVTLLFCLGDLGRVLNSPTAFPYIQVFYGSFSPVHASISCHSLINPRQRSKHPLGHRYGHHRPPPYLVLHNRHHHVRLPNDLGLRPRPRPPILLNHHESQSTHPRPRHRRRRRRHFRLSLVVDLYRVIDGV